MDAPIGGDLQAPNEPEILIFTNETYSDDKKVSSAQQYYDRVILMKFDKQGDEKYDLSHMGAINWILLLNLGASWVIIFFALMKVSQAAVHRV